MVTSRDNRNHVTDAPVGDGPPRNQAEAHTVVQHRESPARQEHGAPQGAGDRHAIYHRPINEPTLGLDLGSDLFEFA